MLLEATHKFRLGRTVVRDTILLALPWAFVVIGGPILLGLVLAWARLRSSKQAQRVDPQTPSDDPSKGMIGHD